MFAEAENDFLGFGQKEKKTPSIAVAAPYEGCKRERC